MAKVKSKARKARMTNMGAELQGTISTIKGKYKNSLEKLNNLDFSKLGPNFNWREQVDGLRKNMKSEIQTSLVGILNKSLDVPERANINPKERSQYMMYLREITKGLPEDVALDFIEREIKEETDPTVREGINRYIELLGQDPKVSAIGKNKLIEIKRNNMTDEEVEIEMAERMQETFLGVIQSIDKYIDEDIKEFENPRIGIQSMTESYITGTIENTLRNLSTTYGIDE